MPRILMYPAILLVFLFSTPLSAVIGGSSASSTIASHVTIITSTRGAFCSAAVIASDILLTAAHCVEPKSDYSALVFESGSPKLFPVARIMLHPRFNPAQFRERKPAPDLAVVKLSQALPSGFRPVTPLRDFLQPKPGETLMIAGYGLTSEADQSTGGKLNAVTLPVIGNTIDSTGIIMTRLSAGSGRSAGACTGDSGAPVFKGGKLAAIVGWSTGSKGKECGGVTGATLVAQQIEWIDATVKLLGGRLLE